MRAKRNLSPRAKRHIRVRGRVSGTPERPRLSVFRSGQHMYAQVIDDTAGHTLASASTIEPAMRGSLAETRRVEEARQVGRTVGERAKARGITAVVFDRGGWLYHGRIKALADGARESGLEF